MKIKCAFLLLIAFLFNGLAATAQSWLWGEQGSAGIKADVDASNVATNKTGNVYQTGGFETSITFGSTTLASSAYEDVYLVKYDQNGNVLWARQSNTASNVFAIGSSVATDDSDNCYIIGNTIILDGGLLDTIVFGSNTLYLSYGQFFLVKYDPNGNVIWAKQADSTIYDGDGGWTVITDKSGHEYVSGNGAGIIKYDRNGNVILTIPQIDYSIGNADANSIATDLSGNIYLAGQFWDSVAFGPYKFYSPIVQDVFIVKFDNNGNVIWAQQSLGNIYSLSVATDRSGAAYLTGVFSDTAILGTYKFISPANTAETFFLLKYNPGGTIAWSKEAIPLYGSSCGSNSICTDDSNHIYISGGESTQQPVSFVFTNDTLSVTNTSINDYPSFLLKLDSTGRVICGSTLSDGNEEGNAVTSDSTGSFVYLGGVFDTTFDIGDKNFTVKNGGFNTYVGRWQSCFNCNLSATIITQQDNILTSGASQGNQWVRNDTVLVGATSQSYTVTATGWYQVINSNLANGCNNTSDSIYVTYIQTVGNNQISIYPNPTNNQIIVKINSSSTDLTGWNLKLIDILGRTIFSMPSLNYSNVINLETLPAAMYFITVTNNTGRTVVPVVKVN